MIGPAISADCVFTRDVNLAKSVGFSYCLTGDFFHVPDNFHDLYKIN